MFSSCVVCHPTAAAATVAGAGHAAAALLASVSFRLEIWRGISLRGHPACGPGWRPLLFLSVDNYLSSFWIMFGRKIQDTRKRGRAPCARMHTCDLSAEASKLKNATHCCRTILVCRIRKPGIHLLSVVVVAVLMLSCSKSTVLRVSTTARQASVLRSSTSSRVQHCTIFVGSQEYIDIRSRAVVRSCSPRRSYRAEHSKQRCCSYSAYEV